MVLIGEIAMRASVLLLIMLSCVGCRPAAQENSAELASLKAELAQLQARPVAAAASAPELGQQMLELQIRHARLWQAGEAQNWLLTQFQLAELRESLDGVVTSNGDHAALQPKRLAQVLPAMLDPPLKQMQDAVDARDLRKFESAYDGLSAACTACHAAADHGFLVIQRPQTPILDNLRAAPLP
jgi:hypothetical protein